MFPWWLEVGWQEVGVSSFTVRKGLKLTLPAWVNDLISTMLILTGQHIGTAVSNQPPREKLKPPGEGKPSAFLEEARRKSSFPRVLECCADLEELPTGLLDCLGSPVRHQHSQSIGSRKRCS